MTPLLVGDKWKIIIFGGISYRGEILNDIWVFDVESGEFLLGSTDTPLRPRYGHSATKIDDKIVVFGGCSSERSIGNIDPNPGEVRYLNDILVMKVSMYNNNGEEGADISIIPYELVGDAPHPRCCHTATLLPSINMLFIIGGNFGAGISFQRVHAINIEKLRKSYEEAQAQRNEQIRETRLRVATQWNNFKIEFTKFCRISNLKRIITCSQYVEIPSAENNAQPITNNTENTNNNNNNTDNINDIDNQDTWKSQGFQLYIGIRII